MRGNILIVDDEAGPRASLRMILKQDHDVRTADCGDAALKEVERELPDLVFLDLRMPGMDGTEVMKVIKSRYPDVDVAIITAFAAVESARLALRLGAVDYLTKPYSVADVERIVDKALAARRQDHDARVLAAQLETMTRDFVSNAGALAGLESGDVNEAVRTLRQFHETFGDDLASVQQLYELGEVTAEVSHDLNNLVTVILASAQFLLERVQDQEQAGRDDVSHWASNIVHAAQDCTKTLQQIRNYVRANVNQEPNAVSVNDLISAAAELTRSSAESHPGDIEFVLRLKTVPHIMGDDIALRNVLVNLIENSLDAIEGDGRIELISETREGWVRVSVKDSGVGMTPEVLKQASQAFFSTKQEHGTGLGLSIAHKVLAKHGGSLQIESEQGVGTTVTLLLPTRAAPQPQPAPCAVAAAPQDAFRGTAIVADDQAGMRDIMVRLLETDGFRVLAATDGQQAWELFEQAQADGNTGPLLVVTDHEMPGMTGRQLAQRVKRADPTVPVIVVSGYSISEPGPEDALVSKPFDINDLLAPVRELTAPRPPQAACAHEASAQVPS